MNPTEPLSIVPCKTDKERAAEIKQEIITTSKDMLDVMTQAAKDGFFLNIQFGPNAFQQVVIQQLTVGKQF